MQQINAKNLAAVLEVTPRRVYQLVDEGVLHRDPDGSFTIPQAFEDYYRHYYRHSNNYHRSRAKRENARAQLAELKYKKLRSRLFPAEDVELLTNDLNATIRTRLSNFTTRVAPLLVGKDVDEIAEILNEECSDELRGLANYNPQFKGEPEE